MGNSVVMKLIKSNLAILDLTRFMKLRMSSWAPSTQQVPWVLHVQRTVS